MTPFDESAPEIAAASQAWTIRPEREADRDAVEKLVDLAFGPGRFAKAAYRLREGVQPDLRLSFVAQGRDTTGLWGSVQFWPAFAGDTPVLLLGPLAVVPELRGRGIGISLMQHGICAAQALEYKAIILVGDEPYYAKVGFSRLSPGQVRLPGPVDPARILGLAVAVNTLAGISGEIRRARIDSPVSANSAGVGPSFQPSI